MKKLYACAIFADRVTKENVTQSRAIAVGVLANSNQEAVGFAIEEGKRVFTIKEGWAVQANAREIDNAFLKANGLRLVEL